MVYAYSFQFHKGSINTIQQYTALTNRRSFNSIKVRLIQDVKYKLVKVELFQFHKGSINTKIRSNINIKCGCFNSIKVRLIPKDVNDYRNTKTVSIP